MCSQYCISLADVKKAHSNIEDLVHITPILTSSILNQLAGRKLFFKCELFQKTGSFKALASKDKPVEQSLISRSFPCVTIRGALNAIQGLTFSPSDGKKPKAVVTHSSGNHGQALSYAAKLKGIPAYIVVPRTAPSCKKSAIQGYGATIIDCEPSDESRTTVAARIVKQTEGTMVHPNQCPAVMAGQGTIALEVLEQALRPEVKVYAAEPCNADDCFQSKLKGELTPNPSPPVTIADGVKSSIGPNTWPIIRDLVDEVFTVTEDEIKHATQLVWERMKLLIEPTAAVGVAAVLGERFRKVVPAAQAICVVLSGGNVDLTSLRWLKQPEGEEAQRPQN
ncbi:serine racemase isoform X4 [Vombatus ursinus]|uniref:serine racemase isoform X4 n=1 Tax=Vombatus ursinus TaxID=29139 RepID=UPI000FFD6884|nr:serine racemase isoform X4 [Vombatus ursinus]